MLAKSGKLVLNGVKNPENIPPYMQKNFDYALLNKLLKYQTDTELLQSSRSAGRLVWEDQPEEITIDFSSFPQEYSCMVARKLCKSRHFDPHFHDDQTLQYLPHRRFVTEFKNTIILGATHEDVYMTSFDSDGNIIGPLIKSTQDGSIERLKDSFVTIRKSTGNQMFYSNIIRASCPHKLRFEPSIEIDEGMILSSRQSQNFSMWLYDHLPRLQRFEIYKQITNRNPKLLLGANIQEWQKETLRLLGFESEHWEILDEFPMKIKKQIVTDRKNTNSDELDICKEDIKWLQKKVFESSIGSYEPSSKRILISRQDSYRRFITNFDEVENFLHSHGFETYKPEKLSIKEQVALFRDAEVVVGAFGAALAAMVFSEDVDVVCAYPPGPWIPGLHIVVANILGHTFHPLFSPPDKSELEKDAHWRDVYIPLDELSKVISTMCL